MDLRALCLGLNLFSGLWSLIESRLSSPCSVYLHRASKRCSPLHFAEGGKAHRIQPSEEFLNPLCVRSSGPSNQQSANLRRCCCNLPPLRNSTHAPGRSFVQKTLLSYFWRPGRTMKPRTKLETMNIRFLISTFFPNSRLVPTGPPVGFNQLQSVRPRPSFKKNRN